MAGMRDGSGNLRGDDVLTLRLPGVAVAGPLRDAPLRFASFSNHGVGGPGAGAVLV
jgi:hypothetical protein